MMPSAPWKRHRQHAAQRGQRSPHIRVLHEISEVLVGREAEPRRRAIDHRVHRIGERPPPRRDRDDDENLDGFLGQGDPEDRMQDLRRARDCRGSRGSRQTARAQSAAAKCWRRREKTRSRPWQADPDARPRRSRATVSAARVPPRPFRSRSEGMREDSSGRQICHFSLLSTVAKVRCGRKSRAGHVPEPARPGSAAQQPRQIFFSCAFTRASSLLSESTYFAPSTFDVGAARSRGLAGADVATAAGGAALS